MSETNKENKAQSNSGSGRNINTGGGMYNEGQLNQSGGQFIGGTVQGNVNYIDNRITTNDEAKLKELFAQLQQHVRALPTNTPEEKEAKADAEASVQFLHEEVEASKKNPEHKPNRVTMKGLIAAFKSVGGPVLSTALTILGFPAVGAGINQFAKDLESPKP